VAMLGEVQEGVPNLRLTMYPWLSGILTMGLTPQAAMAGTASCMAPSGNMMLDQLLMGLSCNMMLASLGEH
jgi:hypothetical protein